MDFTNIQLPPFLIADLYKNSLIDAPQKQNNTSKNENIKIQPIEENQSLRSLGGNGKHIMIGLKEEKARIISEEKLDFLTKILGACHLNMDDVAIVNLKAGDISIEQLQTELAPSILILFEISCQSLQIPMIIPEYQIQHYANLKILTASPLEKMMNSTTEARLEKSRLWMSLKLLFNL